MTKPRFAMMPALLLAALPAPLAAQNGLVDLSTALRCSAAFGLIAAEQQRGIASALKDYPPLSQRGREFFVQTGARLMDEQKLTREQVQARFKAEVDLLQAEVIAAPDPAAKVRSIMVPCLALLDATVPPSR
jgi:hypothetical protein